MYHAHFLAYVHTSVCLCCIRISLICDMTSRDTDHVTRAMVQKWRSFGRDVNGRHGQMTINEEIARGRKEEIIERKEREKEKGK